jgi:hypothetical protein
MPADHESYYVGLPELAGPSWSPLCETSYDLGEI